MFHAKNGLYIERLINGDVRIIKRLDGKPDSPIMMEEILPPNEFASFICNGSRDQENFYQWFAAMQFLGIPGYETGWEQYQHALKYQPTQPKNDKEALCNVFS